jgi:hypothetical protein
VVFSPRKYQTLGYYPWIFPVHDGDLAAVDVATGDLGFVFDGWDYLIDSIDAADFMVDGGQEPKLVFSVRQGTMCQDGNGENFFVDKNQIACLDMNTHTFELLFEGAPNLNRIDAVSVMPDGNICFSPYGNYFHNSNPPYFFEDQDLAMFDPNTQQVTPFFYGADIGLHDLDGADVVNGFIYFSVRDATTIYYPPNQSIHFRDADVGCFDEAGNTVTRYLEGNAYPYRIKTMDALIIDGVFAPEWRMDKRWNISQGPTGIMRESKKPDGRKF